MSKKEQNEIGNLHEEIHNLKNFLSAILELLEKVSRGNASYTALDAWNIREAKRLVE